MMGGGAKLGGAANKCSEAISGRWREGQAPQHCS